MDSPKFGHFNKFEFDNDLRVDDKSKFSVFKIGIRFLSSLLE